MADYTRRFTEEHRIDDIDPDGYANTTVATSWISMRDYHRAVAMVRVGDMGAGATVDMELQQATDSSGSNGKTLVSGNGQTKEITQLTQAGGDANASPSVIELQTEEMDVANEFDYVRAVVTIVGTGVYLYANLLRTISRFPPVDASNLQEVIAAAP